MTPFGLFFILVDRPFFVLCKGFIAFPGYPLVLIFPIRGVRQAVEESSVLLEEQLDSHYRPIPGRTQISGAIFFFSCPWLYFGLSNIRMYSQDFFLDGVLGGCLFFYSLLPLVLLLEG